MTIPSRIVDAHHHFWDLGAVRYPWLMERGKKRFFGDPTPIQKNFLPADLKDQSGALPIQKTVHIQVGAAPDQSVAETVWLDQQAETTGLPAGIVAFADLTAPDLEDQLAEHAGASLRLRGVRQIVSRSTDEDEQTGTANLLYDDRFLAGQGTLAQHGLTFDLQLTPPFLGAAASLFSKVEGARVALCHAGSLQEYSAAGRKHWTDGLKNLRDSADVLCKISGFGMFQHQWTDEDVRAWVLQVIDVFSPSHVAFGSNFPVDGLYASYERVWSAFFKATADFSDEERAMMYAGNAEAFYRI